MREMTIYIDNSESVQAAVNRISEGWFDPVKMYAGLKADGKTISSNFWNVTTRMLTEVSGFLGWTSALFIGEWDQRCITSGIKIMGYHCTRHSDKNAFTEKGILPFSEETIKLAENQTLKARGMLEIRSKKPGPSFHISYTYAKDPSAHTFFEGPEILLCCAGRHVDVDTEQSVPLLIHCAIPYSIIPDPEGYLAFCILSAYFNYIDPSDESNLSFEGYSIDLEGTILDPCHIVRIEEI
jgi:hypothetical protein